MERHNPLLYMQFSDHRLAALVALALLIVIMLLSVHLERSRFGLSLLSVKQNELAAEAAGIDSYRWKLKAITLSGAVAGAAGGLYAVVLLVVTPTSVFGMPVSAQALIVTMFGGVGTVWGAVAGAVILVPMSEILHAELGNVLPGVQGVVFGIAVILIVLTMPQGIVWAFRDRFARPFAKPLHEAQTYRADGEGAYTIGEQVLEVDHLSRRFGGLKAVDDVKLTVARQEIVGIIGPNGAGKTTLFNLLNGLVAADSGRVRLGGADLVGLRPSRICRLGVGRTFQVVRLFPRMTLFQNVLVGALVKASSDAAARKAALEAIRRVGIEPLRDTPASELSNYELRLMELARALAPRPEIVLLDEPFAGLAASEVESLMQLIRILRADGRSVAINEHTMHAMVKLVDRFVVLDHGEVIAEGAPEAVVKNPTVIRAYLGEKWKTDACA
jgi:branched-chain amino acid transport system permease protein